MNVGSSPPSSFALVPSSSHIVRKTMDLHPQAPSFRPIPRSLDRRAPVNRRKHLLPGLEAEQGRNKDHLRQEDF